MLTQWRRLALFTAAGLTALAVLFPPFVIDDSAVEYGFAFANPPTVARAIAAMGGLAGAQGTAMATGLFRVAVDWSRLFVELAATWGVFALLRATVLRSSPALRTGDAR